MRVSDTTSVTRPTTISLDRLLHTVTAVSVVSDPADAHRPWRSTAATAVAGREGHGAAHCVVLTSDPGDLRLLLADEPGVRVVTV